MRKDIFLVIKRNSEGKELGMPKKQKIKLANAEIIFWKYSIFMSIYWIFFPLFTFLRFTYARFPLKLIPFKSKLILFRDIKFDKKSFLNLKTLLKEVDYYEYKREYYRGYPFGFINHKPKNGIGLYFVPSNIKNMYYFNFYLRNKIH